MSQGRVLAKTPGFYKFKIGEFDLVPLHEGVIAFDRPKGFVSNASDDEVGEAYAAVGMPRDKLTITFNALLVRAGERLVLIDAGLGDGAPAGAGQLAENLKAAGVEPGDISAVIISHFHSDHIGGLRRADGSLMFANAEILVPAKEWEFWMDEARMNSAPDALKGTFAQSQKVFGAQAKQIRRFDWGKEILPGFTSIDVHGHTPGMSAIEIASGKESTIFVADITNNPLIFVRHPEWRMMFDMDADAATQSRKMMLDRAASDKTRVSFYHAPFPATGYIVRSGAGYEYLPALWTSA